MENFLVEPHHAKCIWFGSQ